MLAGGQTTGRKRRNAALAFAGVSNNDALVAEAFAQYGITDASAWDTALRQIAGEPLAASDGPPSELSRLGEMFANAPIDMELPPSGALRDNPDAAERLPEPLQRAVDDAAARMPDALQRLAARRDADLGADYLGGGGALGECSGLCIVSGDVGSEARSSRTPFECVPNLPAMLEAHLRQQCRSVAAAELALQRLLDEHPLMLLAPRDRDGPSVRTFLMQCRMRQQSRRKLRVDEWCRELGALGVSPQRSETPPALDVHESAHPVVLVMIAPDIYAFCFLSTQPRGIASSASMHTLRGVLLCRSLLSMDAAAAASSK